jgi:CHAT domain-containing protein/lipopolysaccharide biosynthesis regulator YciM
MKQPRLRWGISISLLMGSIGIIPAAIGQNPSIVPTRENEELVEAGRINEQSTQLYQQGKYDQAILLSQRSLSILEKVLGKEHLYVAASLNNLAQLYKAQGKYDQAEPIFQRSLAIRKKLLGENDPSVATSLNNLAGLYQAQGRYEQALPLYQRSLIIREKVLGKEHLDVANSLNNLAELYKEQGKYEQAMPLYQRSLSILEQALGKEHLAVAISLNNLAGLYKIQGEYTLSQSLYQRSLSILEKALGKEHPDIANSLNNLAELYKAQGKYEQALQLYQRSLSILEKTLGKDHPAVATSLNNLAGLYKIQGKYEQAASLFQRSLAANEKLLGENSYGVAISLNNLAQLYEAQGKYIEAQALYQRSLTTWEKVLGKEHPDIAISLNNLAGLYKIQGKFNLALPLFKRSLTIREKALGKKNPDVATSLNNLAGLYEAQGKYAEALPLYQRSLSIREEVLGKEHPDVADSLTNLAIFYYVQGNTSLATHFLSRGLTIEENNLSRSIAIGSERDKQDYIQRVLSHPSLSISLALQSTAPAAQQLAITNVLRRQGRVLDAMAETVQTLRSQLKDRPDLQQLLDKWKSTLQQQSALRIGQQSQENSRDYQARFDALAQEQQQLETQLSIQSATFRQNFEPIQPQRVQMLIPQTAALVQIVKYIPFRPQADYQNRWDRSSPHYAAVVLRATGTARWTDLGPAAAIDHNIQTFREYLQDGSSSENRQRNQIARTLDRQIMQPIRQHFGDAQHLLLSPDAALNLIPFEALKDEEGKYLIERYAFSYLTTGRDLIRFSDSPPSRQVPVVFSEIDYNQTSQITKRPTVPKAETRSIDLALTNFSPLETSGETQQIRAVFPNALIFRDREATKTALQKIHAPSILHLATHGFFIPAQKTGTSNPQPDNPLTRSGIILAGANRDPKSLEQSGDGILTGLEAAGLDLYGTQLVVLSACETGLGDISAGEGIYGLRRALVIAGSQTQVLSLWKVKNDATTELMKNFYQNLQAGKGRHQALREAQLQLLNSPNYSNPHYWAAFIPSGNWTSLRGN